MHKYLLTVIFLLCNMSYVAAQTVMYDNDGMERDRYGNIKASTRNDSTVTTDVPFGITMWRVDEQFGTRIPTSPDTLMTHFPQKVFTSGPTMQYNTTGNYGSPRVSRVYSGAYSMHANESFFFSHPYDYVVVSPRDFLFTNTKSPFTSITFNTCGNKLNGEDRITAKFSVNAGKKLGFGFLLDYLLGRGYYPSQNTGHFTGGLYSSYVSDKYNMHMLYAFNYLKNAENGGLENDECITHPEKLPYTYRPNEMTVRLSRAYNYIHANTLFLTHRYNFGNDQVARRDTIVTHIDSLQKDSIRVIPVMEYRPIAAVVHTARVGQNNRRFLSRNSTEAFYAKHYFLDEDPNMVGTRDKTKNVSVINTVALELCEGFRTWVKSGLRVYLKHDYERFVLLSGHPLMQTYNENDITLGGQLLTAKNRFFQYHVTGETTTSGKNWGEFNVNGNFNFNIPTRRDSLIISAKAHIRNEEPSFYFRHYHSRNAWWDKSLDNEFSTMVGGVLQWRKTTLEFQLVNTKNYTHFAHNVSYDSQHTAADNGKLLPLYQVDVQQCRDNIQTIVASLKQDFSWGPLRWENELTFQKSSNEQQQPLPLITAYTNLYFKFCIAKVLNTEIGADASIFTQYFAPDYDPAIGHFVTQSTEDRVKVGNYPWVNVYANFHLKRARFYVMYSHVNKINGKYFLTPHYPTNQRVLHVGVSWNFIN